MCNMDTPPRLYCQWTVDGPHCSGQGALDPLCVYILGLLATNSAPVLQSVRVDPGTKKPAVHSRPTPNPASACNAHAAARARASQDPMACYREIDRRAGGVAEVAESVRSSERSPPSPSSSPCAVASERLVPCRGTRAQCATVSMTINQGGRCSCSSGRECATLVALYSQLPGFYAEFLFVIFRAFMLTKTTEAEPSDQKWQCQVQVWNIQWA